MKDKHENPKIEMLKLENVPRSPTHNYHYWSPTTPTFQNANQRLLDRDSGNFPSTPIYENSPIRLVRHTVSAEDDPTLPTFTFRVWVIGILMSAVLAFINQYFYFRRFPFVLNIIAVMVLTYPLGKLMECLPKARYKLFNFTFYLNPGPFNMKEHTLIVMFTSSSANWPYGMLFITATKLQWGIDFGILGSLAIILFTQVLGFGVGGYLRKVLVYPSNMFWPTSLVSIALLRAIHDTCAVSKKHIRRFKFFFIVTLISFLFYFLPGYLFQMLAVFPLLCLVVPNTNLVGNQLGAPLYGLGLGSISLDWSAITSNLGSPLVTPFYVAANIMVGFVLVVWVIVPLGYYNNIWDTQIYPIAGYAHYDIHGSRYDVSKVLDPLTMKFDINAYDNYSPLRITWMMACIYGSGFAALGSVITYVILHHGRSLYTTLMSPEFKIPDVHCKLMARYKEVPRWWYTCLILLSLGVGLAMVEVFPQVQLPWYGLIFAFAFGIFFAIPNAILYALTSQFISTHIAAEMLGGLIFPGMAVGNMLFKTVGFLTGYQALSYLYNLKLGHYLKIPPRKTFQAVLVGTVVAAVVNVLVSQWLMNTVPGLCEISEVWTCETARVFSKASILWGLIGTSKIFGADNLYHPILWCFLIGILLPIPIYILNRRFPNSILRYVHVPILFGGIVMLPPAYPFQYTSWFLLAFLFNFVLFRYRFEWWSRYNYIFSAGMDCGVAFAFFIIYLLVSNNVVVNWWGNNVNQFCPTGNLPLKAG